MTARTGTSCCQPRRRCSLSLGPPATAVAQQPAETAIPDKVRLFIPFKDYSQEDNKRILGDVQVAAGR